MAIFKAKEPNMAVSILGKLIKFGASAKKEIMDEAIIEKLSSLPGYTRVDTPKKAEIPKASKEKPKKKKNKSK